MKVESFDAPFRHWILSDAVPPALASEAFDQLPLPAWSRWVRYDNDCERGKRTARGIDFNMPYCPPSGPQVKLLDLLCGDPFVHFLSSLAGIEGLRADPELYGGGVHITDPGGWLLPHLDYALNPNGLERRLSLVLFLNPFWRPEWGGAFELWDDAARQCVKRVLPAFNTAVLFENGDLSYHATQQTAAEAPPRVTAAVYYLADPRPGCCRKRALFVPRR